jgi:hypothetical protein
MPAEARSSVPDPAQVAAYRRLLARLFGDRIPAEPEEKIDPPQHAASPDGTGLAAESPAHEAQDDDPQVSS